MDFEQLAIFLDVCETMSFSETGRRLFVTRSAVMQRIKHLENELGVKLFERSTHALLLTPAGKELVPLAKQTLSLGNVIAKKMSRFNQRLTVGTLANVAPVLLNKLLADFSASVELNFRAVQSVRKLPVAIDLVEYYEINKVFDPDFTFHPLKNEPLVVTLPADHPLVEKSEISPEDLSGLDLALEKEGISETSDKVLHYLEDNYPGIKLHIFDVYDASFFSTAIYRGYLTIVSESMAQMCYPYVSRPLAVPYEGHYGLYIRKHPKPVLAEFIKKI